LDNVEPQILKLIENGTKEFYEKVATRILIEHGEDIFINNCKKCGKLTRSPQAKQCRHCGYNWFDNDHKQPYTCA
jgi:predicted Zn-ribbon and HTH transcriptional regulator